MARKKERAPESRQEKYKRLHPWVRYVEFARRRCSDVSSEWYKWYGAKGVTCDLTAKDLEEIWKRDGAHSLNKPSLDRVDPNGNYTKANVRFIEFKVNSRLAWDETFKFLYNNPEAAPELPTMCEE